jgi:hypothetical protein
MSSYSVIVTVSSSGDWANTLINLGRTARSKTGVFFIVANQSFRCAGRKAKLKVHRTGWKEWLEERPAFNDEKKKKMRGRGSKIWWMKATHWEEGKGYKRGWCVVISGHGIPQARMRAQKQ